jgi:hypothetical protein
MAKELFNGLLFGLHVNIMSIPTLKLSETK